MDYHTLANKVMRFDAWLAFPCFNSNPYPHEPIKTMQKSPRPEARKDSHPAWQLLTYEKRITVGLGIAVLVLIFTGLAVGTAYIANDFLDRQRHAFLRHIEQIEQRIETADETFRITVMNAELGWGNKEGSSRQLNEEFRDNANRLVVQPTPHARPVLVLSARSGGVDPTEVATFLSLAAQMSRLSTATSVMRGMQVDEYFYTTSGHLLGVMPRSGSFDLARLGLLTVDIEKLIGEIQIDVARINRDRPTDAFSSTRPLQWLPPAPSQLSSSKVLRLVSPGVHEEAIFGIFVMEFPVDYIFNESDQGNNSLFRGIYTLMSRKGEVVSDVVRDGADNLQLPRVDRINAGSGLTERLSTGGWSISDDLARTEWRLAYSLPLTFIVSAVAPQLAKLALGISVSMAFFWIILKTGLRRSIKPLIDRSNSVFESDQLSRSLIETAPISIGLIDANSGVIYLSSPAMTAFGAKVKIPIAPLMHELVHRQKSRHRKSTLDADIYWPSGTWQEDLSVPAWDGTEVNLAVQLAVAQYRGEQVLVVAFTDITEKIRLENSLRAAKHAADSANAAKSIFLATISHEIKTPLNLILGNLELLARSSMSEEQYDRVSVIQSSSDGLAGIINDLLDLSKVEAGHLDLENIAFDPVLLIEDALIAYEPLAKRKGIKLYLDLSIPYPQSLQGDPQRIRQILNNLLTNAVKFTIAGHVTLEASLSDIADEHCQLTVAVSDTGVGIDSSGINSLFRDFSQVDPSINRRFGGTGLGLALCYKLVKQMGGEIYVESELDVGSRFSIILPLRGRLAEPEKISSLGDERCIVLTSNDIWRNWAKRHLEMWGIEVCAFEDPASVPVNVLGTAPALLIVGPGNLWSATAENCLLEAIPVAIDCCPEGPRRPIRAGKIYSLSCYSISGLRIALKEIFGKGPSLQKLVPLSNIPRQQLSLPTAEQPNRALRVLVTDDDLLNRNLIGEQLGLLGCMAFVVGTGHQALEALITGEWDILLTDMNMPGMNGCQLAKEARLLDTRVVILGMTASSAEDDRRKYAASGIMQILPKPITLRSLYTQLAEFSIRYKLGPNIVLKDPNTLLAASEKIPTHLYGILESSLTDAISEIKDATSENDSARILTVLHSMRGSLGVFGQYSLAAICEELEIQIKSELSESHRSIYTSESLFAQLEDAISSMLQSMRPGSNEHLG